MENATHCPNCNTKLKGLVSSIKLYSNAEMNFIQEYANVSDQYLCAKCGKDQFENAKQNYISDQNLIKNEIKRYYRSFPILTIQPQKEWQFDALGIVTAQATMDNRVSSKSLLDMLLGVNDNVVDLDTSANTGEKSCMELLRQKTYALGGNAVVGIDIDYAEFGLKGELMLICMAGTAIKINDLDKVNSKIVEAKNKFSEYSMKVERLSKFHTILN